MKNKKGIRRKRRKFRIDILLIGFALAAGLLAGLLCLTEHHRQRIQELAAIETVEILPEKQVAVTEQEVETTPTAEAGEAAAPE